MAFVDTPRGDALQAVGTSKSRFAIISGISRSTLQQHLRQADRSLDGTSGDAENMWPIFVRLKDISLTYSLCQKWSAHDWPR